MKRRVEYRFKTLQELKDEFGPDWRDKVHMGWSPALDRLSGFPVSEGDYNISTTGTLRYPLNTRTPSHKRDMDSRGGPFAHVSLEMLTSEPLPAGHPAPWLKSHVKPEAAEGARDSEPFPTIPGKMPVKVEQFQGGTIHRMGSGVSVVSRGKKSFVMVKGGFLPEGGALTMASDLISATAYMKVLGTAPANTAPSTKRRRARCHTCGKTRPCYSLNGRNYCPRCVGKERAIRPGL